MTTRALLGICGVALTATFVAAAGKETASVRIHATDVFGNGLRPIRVTRFLESGVGGRNFSSLFAGAEAEGIPYGKYIVTIRAGDVGLSGTIVIDRPLQFLVFSGTGWNFDRPEGAPIPRGATHRIVGLPKNVRSPVWVRLIALFQDDAYHYRTSLVRDDGSFSVLVDMGEYALVVLDGRGTLFSGMVSVKNFKSKIEVNLETNTITQSE